MSAAYQPRALKPLTYNSLVALQADLTPPDGTPAQIIADPFVPNNTIYLKSGKSGSGSWVADVDRTMAVIKGIIGSDEGYRFADPGNYASTDPSSWLTAVITRTLNAKVADEVCILDFGADPSGTMDSTAAMEAAFAYLLWLNDTHNNAGGAGCVYFPAGLYTYTHDLTIMASRFVLRGDGLGTCLTGLNNARLIIGNVTYDSTTSPPTKSGIENKVLYPTIRDMSIKPNDNHAGEVIYLSYTDNSIIENCDIGPYGNDGSTVTHGVRYGSCQYSTMRNTIINVNGAAVQIDLVASDNENEDHYSFYSCWFYNGKYANSGYLPACFAFRRGAGRGAPIYHIGWYSCHFGTFMTGPTPLTSGLRIEANDAVDFTTVLNGQVISCMFEGVSYPVDQMTGTPGNGRDTSSFGFSGTSCLVGAIVAYGHDRSKGNVVFTDSSFTQFTNLCVGVQGVFVGRNRTSGMDARYYFHPTYAYGDYTGQRFSNAQALDGAVMETKGQYTVAEGATSQVVTHSMTVRPSIILANASWNTTVWISDNSSDTQFTLSFGTPAPAGGGQVFFNADTAYT